MQDDEREVPAGALAAALEMLEALHGRDGGASPQQLTDQMTHELKIWGQPAVTEAFGTIIFVATQQLQFAHDAPEVLDGLDGFELKMRVVAAVVTRLRRDLPEVPAKHLPIVAGVLTAAFLGDGPYAWRTSHGPVEPDEHLAWCYTAWLLVDLVDDTTGRPGGFAEIFRKILSDDR